MLFVTQKGPSINALVNCIFHGRGRPWDLCSQVKCKDGNFPEQFEPKGQLEPWTSSISVIFTIFPKQICPWQSIVHLFWVMPSQSCVSARSVIWRLASSNRTNSAPNDPNLPATLHLVCILKTNKWLLRKGGSPILGRLVVFRIHERTLIVLHCIDGTHTETILHPFPDSGRCLKTQHHRCVRLDLCMIHQAHSQYYAATKNDQIHLTWSASEFQIVTRHASGNLQCLHFPLLIHAPCNNAFQMQTNGNIISNHVQ